MRFVVTHQFSPAGIPDAATAAQCVCTLPIGNSFAIALIAGAQNEGSALRSQARQESDLQRPVWTL